MGRFARIFDPRGVYHVVNRGNNKERVFLVERDYERFLEAMDDVRALHGVDFFHYCLMPNHVHLLLRPNGDLSAAMHGIFMPFAKWFCAKYGRRGHVWQGPFRPTPVFSDAHLYASGNYVEMNPVRAKIAARPEKWPYSSYRYYAYGEENRLITESPYFRNLDPDDRSRRAAYQRDIVATRLDTQY